MSIVSTLTQIEDQTRLGLVRLINIQAAKTHLSRLLEEAAAGEEIVIAKAGRPYVKLVPCTSSTTARTLGGWEGKVEIADDFDEPNAEILALFEGRPAAPRGGKSPKKAAGKPNRTRAT